MGRLKFISCILMSHEVEMVAIVGRLSPSASQLEDVGN